MAKRSTRVLAVAVTLMLTLSILPGTPARASTDSTPTITAIVSTESPEGASLRDTPTLDAALVATLPSGSEVVILEGPIVSELDGTSWYFVTTGTISGYLLEAVAVLSTTPATIEDQQETEDTTEPGFSVTGEATLLLSPGESIICRQEPLADATPLETLFHEQPVQLTGTPVGPWQPIVCASVRGFVRAELVALPGDPRLAPLPTPPAQDDQSIPIEEEPVVESTTIPEFAADSQVSAETEASVVPTPEPTLPGEPYASSTTESTSESAPNFDVDASSIIIGNAVVTGTGGAGLRCRAGSSMDAVILTVLQEGATVGLTTTWGQSWQAVNCNGTAGYVWSQYLQIPDENGEQAAIKENQDSDGAFVTVVNTGNANLRCRSEASFDGAILTLLSAGSVVPVRGGPSGVWLPVTCANSDGWIHIDYTDGTSAPTAQPNQTGGPATLAPEQDLSQTTGLHLVVSSTGGLGLRFRSEASFSAPVITVLPEGTIVEGLTGSTGNWTAVRFDGNTGFVHMDYLAESSGAVAPLPSPSPDESTEENNLSAGVGGSDLSAGTAALVVADLRLRSEASLGSTILAVAPAGTVVEIAAARTNAFYAVNWDGLTGYMHGDYLAWTDRAPTTRTPEPVSPTIDLGNAGANEASTSGQQLVDYAMRYVGYPYIWATHGPNSFDCSGFTYWVTMNVLGTNIGAGTWTQWASGAPVPYGELQVGDLVFFQNTYTAGLSHVGMYIGNNQFVHAANESTGVIVSNLTSDYYATRWFGARRLV